MIRLKLLSKSFWFVSEQVFPSEGHLLLGIYSQTPVKDNLQAAEVSIPDSQTTFQEAVKHALTGTDTFDGESRQ